MDADEWNDRYREAAENRESVWSLAPNEWVAEALADLEPGTAVDLAAGEGRNALWLAQRGWRVTAVDFAAVGLSIGAGRAEELGLEVQWQKADATLWRTREPVDLVLIAYLQLPAAELRAAIGRAVAALAPGGVLAMVGHDSTNTVGGPREPAVLWDLEVLREAASGLEISRLERRDRLTPSGVAVDAIMLASTPQPIEGDRMPEQEYSAGTSRQWSLRRRPSGHVADEDVSFDEVELPPLREGEVRVRNEFVSVDPYMRARMNDAKSYIPPFELDKPMLGGAVGRVVESRSPKHNVGDLVEHYAGWRDVAQGSGAHFTVRRELPGLPASVYLGALGVPGLTAWVGLTAVAALKPGETVFVSGAAGAVGTAVGQIARELGAARVIGSAGTPEKVELLTSKYGFDAAFNYKDGRVSRQLAALAPDGIDVYFDTVGGDHLEAAIFSMNDFGRAAICGSIASYNATEAPVAPRNLYMLTTKSLTLQGFTITNYQHLVGEFVDRIGPLVASGDFAWDETVVDGVENALEAFRGLMRGENTGKMLVRV
ncbi:MAG: NADP-dependent oxidoreductase [Microbacteriaceae bacterium]|nr:NADP-dependent oxidoreductase [Microbacteriaceae bacterium]